MKIREDRFPTFRTFMKGLKTKRREWFKIVTSNGGVNNANTSDDRTYYYVIFQFRIGPLDGIRRLLHPIINK
jgi:hypothetical protein